jgi:hypothetical protein
MAEEKAARFYSIAASDHAALGEVARELKEKHPGSLWTQKALVWLH